MEAEVRETRVSRAHGPNLASAGWLVMDDPHSQLPLKLPSHFIMPAPQAQATPQKKHHKSVRSLTRDFEEQSPSIANTLLTPTPPQAQAQAHSSHSSHSNHSRVGSVLLASPQYPSTLLSADVSPTRTRTISGGSSSSLSPEALRSASIGIASASYPSTR